MAPERGRDGERVRGFELEAVVDVEVLVASSGTGYGCRRPSEPPWKALGISDTGTAMSSKDFDLRFFE